MSNKLEKSTRKIKKKPNNSSLNKKILIGVLILILALVGLVFYTYESTSTSGGNFIKVPETVKPTVFTYCEVDNDCTISRRKIETCCNYCHHPLNVQATEYLAEWYDLNCMSSNKKYCHHVSCSAQSLGEKVKCEENKCVWDLG